MKFRNFKAVLILLSFSLLLFFPLSSLAQENCPDGYKCITEKQAKEIRKIIENRKCMEKAVSGENDQLKFSTNPHTIIVTEDGQVFSKGKMKSDLKWCEWELSFFSNPDLTVLMEEGKQEHEWKFEFRPRVRLGLLIHFTDIGRRNFQSLLEPALLFEPFHVGLFHPEAHIGIRSFGLGGGVDITRNMDLLLSAVSKWKEPTPIRPVIGFSLSFN